MTDFNDYAAESYSSGIGLTAGVATAKTKGLVPS